MSPSSGERYLSSAQNLWSTVSEQMGTIRKVADLFAESILQGHLVHLFGSGHSRIMVEEMWPRYGSFQVFTPLSNCR